VHVCLDGRCITDHFPGIGRYVHSLVEALAEHAPDDRFSVLVTPGQRGGRFSLSALAERPNIGLVPVSAGVFNPLGQWRCRSAIRSTGADLFHATYWLGPWWPGRPSLLTCYDLIGRRAPGMVPSLKGRLLDAAVWLSLRRARRVLAISEAVARDLTESAMAPTDRVRVTPLAVGAAFRPPTAQAVATLKARLRLPQRYLLYVGIDKPHKNLATVIRAWGRLLVRRPELTEGMSLVLAGPRDRRYRRLTEAYVTHFATPDAVRILGPVDEADLPTLYGGAAAFVFPSRHEGFGLPLLEAMACGAPVLSSDATSLPEVAGDAALLLDPLDVGAWSAALERLLADPALAADLRARGLERAARFNWGATAEATLAAYRELLAETAA
jgi:glycosyltransferase involved in cell wall biosynthesis